MTHNVRGRNDFALNHVVGEIQQAAQEGLIARHTFLHGGLAVTGRWRGFQNESTFGADWHNHRVFHHLCLYQAQYFGAEIFRSIRPAQTAARHFATA